MPISGRIVHKKNNNIQCYQRRSSFTATQRSRQLDITSTVCSATLFHCEGCFPVAIVYSSCFVVLTEHAFMPRQTDKHARSHGHVKTNTKARTQACTQARTNT